jgi:flagellar biosynthetic protein FlhB
MAEQDQDKSEQASPFKLREAKHRGQVAKSLDFNSFAMIGSVLAVFYLWGPQAVEGGLRLERALFAYPSSAHDEVFVLLPWIKMVLTEAGVLLAPFFGVVLVVAVLSNMMQTGPVFTFFPLKPDPQRLNPVQGFKRIFSLRMLFEAVKSVIKLALFGTVSYAMLVAMLPVILQLADVDPKLHAGLFMDQTATLLFKLTLVIMIVALLDLAYTRWDFGKKMRMSRREMKEEVKRREGDPQVRAKIRELQREAAKRSRSVGRVPDADVLITNPTHLAVALKYERGQSTAPRVIAKGAGEVALGMRALATRHNVTVVEEKMLARMLFAEVDVDEPIPEALFEPVARLYARLLAAPTGHARLGVQV